MSVALSHIESLKRMSVSELREAFKVLGHKFDDPPPDYTWERHTYELAAHVQRDDPEHFLRWSTITATMFVGTAPFVGRELKILRGASDAKRWQEAIEEVWFGDPPPLWFYTRSSGNLVHQAYHLKNWEDTTGFKVGDLDSIFEFGGGYGAMALLARRLGFRGRYVIHDIPEVSLLQRYWLSNIGVWDIELQTEMPSRIEADLLIACFSVSEFPLYQRRTFEEARVRSYLIAYQDGFGGIDNMNYFRDFEDAKPEISWFGWEMPSLGGRYYLFGLKEV